jgi:HTH-type transcriptional regulator/antitoxin HigA
MDIKPIRTEAEYQAALQEIDLLFDTAPNSPEEDRLEVLSLLVEAYEAEHYPIYPPDPIEAILHIMDAYQLEPTDLELFIGSPEQVTKVLSRQEPLTLAMIRKLHEGLGIPAEILIRPSVTMAS